jgi:hypothetical protein
MGTGLGGYRNVPVDSSDVLQAARVCAQAMNLADANIRIVSAQSQLVAGMNYILDLFVADQHVIARVFRDLQGIYSIRDIQHLGL